MSRQTILILNPSSGLNHFCAGYYGAVLMVSHDRAFLDNVTKRTIEISLGKIYDYKASWSKYLVLRAERREQQIAAYRNQQKMIEDTEKFIDRFQIKGHKGCPGAIQDKTA